MTQVAPSLNMRTVTQNSNDIKDMRENMKIVTHLIHTEHKNVEQLKLAKSSKPCEYSQLETKLMK